MKVVIDIPKEHYENLAKIANAGKEPLGYLERVVMRGTPLPAKHGRLIDANELLEHAWRDRLDSRERIAEMIENMPTIIPTDKGDRI